MPVCAICKRKKEVGKGTFFGMPKDEKKRRKWMEACGKPLSASARICSDHFLRSDIITAGRNCVLMPNAVPKLTIIQTEHENIPIHSNGRNLESSAICTSYPPNELQTE